MYEISIKLNCHEKIKNRTKVILNLFAPLAQIKFVPAESNPDILYGEHEGDYKLHIPLIDYEFTDDEWCLYGSRSRLILPGFIQPDALLVNEKKLGIDLFSLSYMFLTAGLTVEKFSRWFPDKINTGLRHVYPFFNSYVDLFIDGLKAAGILPEAYQKKSPWPQDAPFAVGVSHDIDIFKRKIIGSILILAGSLVSKGLPGGLSGAFTGLLDSVKSAVTFGRNPYNQLAAWLGIDNTATYFVFSGKRGSSKDPTYKAGSIARELSRFDNVRFEIALHNGIGTWDDMEELEKNRMGLSELFKREIKGVRPHYLNFELPGLWGNARNFSYSSSVGSDTVAGFSCGINHPFFGFDLDSGQLLDILELPIGIMDCALLSIKDETLLLRTIDEIIVNCKNTHGLLVLDWHGRTAYEPDYPKWLSTYKMILDKARDHGAYIASLEEIDRYWRKYCEYAYSY